MHFDVSLAFWSLDSTRALPNDTPLALPKVARHLCSRAPRNQVVALSKGEPNARCLAISKCYEQITRQFAERSDTFMKNFLEFEMTHAKIMLQMSENGFALDESAANKMLKSLTAGKAKTEKQLRKQVKNVFSPGFENTVPITRPKNGICS